MAAEAYLERVDAFLKERGSSLPPRVHRLLGALARAWGGRWGFVGRSTEWGEGEEGVYLHLGVQDRGHLRYLASLRVHLHGGEARAFIQAPNPERHLWVDDGGLAERLDALLPLWRALEVVSGEGDLSALVRLEDMADVEDASFVVDDLLDLLES